MRALILPSIHGVIHNCACWTGVLPSGARETTNHL